ncbi:MAG: hypothetical protein KKD18_03980 [Nanoarchaeota archaeon]|nr:hypothetical protein [Nanoarchaeota archaeon]MBU0977551.1 hypothetical protein [Nanoarchaeota archaeon]
MREAVKLGGICGSIIAGSLVLGALFGYPETVPPRVIETRSVRLDGGREVNLVRYDNRDISAGLYIDGGFVGIVDVGGDGWGDYTRGWRGADYPRYTTWTITPREASVYRAAFIKSGFGGQDAEN